MHVTPEDVCAGGARSMLRGRCSGCNRSSRTMLTAADTRQRAYSGQHGGRRDVGADGLQGAGTRADRGDEEPGAARDMHTTRLKVRPCPISEGFRPRSRPPSQGSRLDVARQHQRVPPPHVVWSGVYTPPHSCCAAATGMLAVGCLTGRRGWMMQVLQCASPADGVEGRG